MCFVAQQLEAHSAYSVTFHCRCLHRVFTSLLSGGSTAQWRATVHFFLTLFQWPHIDKLDGPLEEGFQHGSPQLL